MHICRSSILSYQPVYETEKESPYQSHQEAMRYWIVGKIEGLGISCAGLNGYMLYTQKQKYGPQEIEKLRRDKKKT